MILYIICLVAVLLALIVWRVYAILPRKFAGPAQRRGKGETCSVGVFLGSGGHTSEMLQLLAGLDFQRYTPRTYIYCTGDAMSVANAVSHESSRLPSPLPPSASPGDEDKGTNYSLLELPRARKVAQPLLSSLFSSLNTLRFAVWHLLLLPLYSGTRIERDREGRVEGRRKGRRPVFDVLLLNGPGTCVVLVVVCYVMRFLGLPSPTIIYVESFARVSSLSLSGKILQHLADRFIVQWDSKGSHGAGTVSPESSQGVGETGGRGKVGRAGGGRWDRREYFGWLI